MLLVSPGSSSPAYIKLFDSTDRKVMLAAEPFLQLTREILTTRSMGFLRAPSVEELFSAKYAHSPFTKTFQDALNEPLVLLHT